MVKEKVIVFGIGNIFQNRSKLLQEKCQILAFLDNGKSTNNFCAQNIPVYKPEEIDSLPKVPIIIMSDYLVEMMLQLISIIGIEECKKRVKIGRIFVPVSKEEISLSNIDITYEYDNGKIVVWLNTDKRVVLDHSMDYLKEIYREYSSQDVTLQQIIKMPLQPIDDCFGAKRGIPIDRYYIEKFLYDHRKLIKGDCLEIAENTYTVKYGEDRVNTTVILHVEGWGENAIKGNLETGEGIVESSFDTMIITQTLMCIYDLEETVKNIYKALKSGGKALITVAGISQISRYDDDNWGHFRSFYMSGLKKLFYPIFGQENVEIIHYGNVKTAISFLYGAVVDELRQEDFDYADINYPVIYGVVVKKN